MEERPGHVWAAKLEEQRESRSHDYQAPIHTPVYTSEERGRDRLALDSFMHAYHTYGKE
jgi:hypothetical protein